MIDFLGGIDNYFVLVDLKFKGIDGVRVERILELCEIFVNKNICVGDKSFMIFGGFRIGINVSYCIIIWEDNVIDCYNCIILIYFIYVFFLKWSKVVL